MVQSYAIFSNLWEVLSRDLDEKRKKHYKSIVN